ncbi:ABC transporter substrate-binding protein [Pseudooceanicola sp. 502str34]
MKIRKRLLSSVVASMVALSATASLAEGPKSGGNLVYLTGTDAQTLDAHFAADSISGRALVLIHEPLVFPDEEGVAQPYLAESWELGEDNVTWTMKLRQGVTFHDGTPFNAEAVKYNFDRIMDEKTGSPRRARSLVIKEIKVIDDYTITFETHEPYAPFINYLTGYNLAMMSPAALAEHGDQYSRHPAGTGAFKLKSWTSGELMTLERNPDYWGGEVYLDTVEIKIVPEDSSRVISLMAGEADVVANVPPILLKRLQNDENVKEVRADGFRTMYLGLNNTLPPFDNRLVREAMQYAVDADALVKGVLGGVGRTGGTFFSPALPGTIDLPATTYDPEKAKALLAEAGYPDGFETTFYAPTGRYLMDRQISEAIQAQLAEVGIKAQIQSPDFAAFLATLREGEKAAMFFIGLGSPTGDPGLSLDGVLKCNAGSNFWKYCNAELDALMLTQRDAMDFDKREAILTEVFKKVREEVPSVVLYYEEQVFAARKNVHGVQVLGNEDIVLRSAWKD